METLTEFGRLWAEAHTEDISDQSIVACVALRGYRVALVNTWPDQFVQTAIRLCNHEGAKTAGCDA